jgi:hypothetical protein
LSNIVETWCPLPGEPLRFRFRFAATLRLRLGASSGLPSAVLFGFLFLACRTKEIARLLGGPSILTEDLMTVCECVQPTLIASMLSKIEKESDGLLIQFSDLALNLLTVEEKSADPSL